MPDCTPFLPSRRDVLAAAALAALPMRSAFASPNDKINLGVIGFGPRCEYDLTSMLKSDQIRCVAMSEVQKYRGEKGKKLVDDAYGNQDCQIHRDFRELLDRKDIDAVLIATGDRWHSAASILAAEAGKDVYSEKPCGITVEACQRLADTMDRTGRVFQAGTQRRSVPNFEQAVNLARSGALGKIHTLHASVYVPVMDNAWLPAQKTPDKETCDWNMWLGPAAWRPFNQSYVDGRWRGIWDFDSGARLLDWGAHTIDLCQWANDADDTMPIRYEPQEDKIVCTYENGVKLIVDFLKEPFGDRSPHYITRLGTCPVRFVGDKGSVETGDSGEIVVTPDSLQSKLPEGSKRVRGLDVSIHAENFFDCIRSRKPTNANQTVMRRSHIASHAAAISWIVGRTLTLDPKTETFVNDPEANLLCSRPERDWVV
ncbi:Inositol 2-dehydrogenase [Rubripirellula amarantea]|uniref:Inositol 2-dehydrogenase n=1 Tax=Rubripirellula amarantea TaxID=2527999 RepID=A0A5C5WHS7_9BACT|nr:Gfo/Idh/MocA family oxidoreductase [Rubripirellula amarantea]TWT50364.1 Inositol 2-dehydrogenase [Rubripirellula amarantea]